MSALHFACGRGHAGCVAALLKADAPYDQVRAGIRVRARGRCRGRVRVRTPPFVRPMRRTRRPWPDPNANPNPNPNPNNEKDVHSSAIEPLFIGIPHGAPSPNLTLTLTSLGAHRDSRAQA